jgi:hypothetical protein
LRMPYRPPKERGQRGRSGRRRRVERCGKSLVRDKMKEKAFEEMPGGIKKSCPTSVV